MATVIQQRLDKIATEMLLAWEAKDVEQVKILTAQANELSTLDKAFHNSFPSPKVSRTKAVTEKRGRTSYDESEVIKSPVEIALVMPYAKFDKVNPVQKEPVEFLQIGMIKNRRNGATDMLIALKACQTVQDLEAGKIYAFKSLRDVTYLAE